MARIEHVETEQRGYFSRLTDATKDAESLRLELKETLTRLSLTESKMIEFATELASMQSKQTQMAHGLSIEKFYTLARTRDALARAELATVLRNTISEDVLQEAQPQVKESTAGLAALYVLTHSIERRNQCVDRIIELAKNIEANSTSAVIPSITGKATPNVKEWLEDMLWMIESSPIEQEPTLRLIERLAALACHRDDLVMAQDLFVRLTKAHTKLGARAQSVPLRMGLMKLVESFARHGIRDKLEICFKRIHELYLAEPNSPKAEMAKNIKRLAALYADEDRLDEAATMYDIALNLLTQALGPEHPEVIQHMRDFGRLYCEIENVDGGLRIYQRLMSLPSIKKDPSLLPLIDEIDEAASIFYSHGHPQQAIKLYQSALDVLTAGPNETHLQKALHLLNKFAANIDGDERVESAVAQHALEQMLQVMTLLGSIGSSEYRETSLKLAQIYNAKQEFARSTELLEKAAHDSQKAEPSELLSLIICKAKSETGMGRYGDAETALKGFLELHPENSDIPDQEMIELFGELGLVASLMKRNEEAEEYFKKELAAVEQAHSPESPRTIGPLMHLAGLFMGKGAWEDAVPYYERILSAKATDLGNEHEDLVSTLMTLAELSRLTKKYIESKQYYERALKITERTFGVDHLKVADVLEKYAALEEESDGKEKSATISERADKIRQMNAPKAVPTA
jgi:tetratricopeptide (TPR) repeat protein